MFRLHYMGKDFACDDDTCNLEVVKELRAGRFPGPAVMKVNGHNALFNFSAGVGFFFADPPDV
ncbi:TPA: hypothetical protein ACGIY5_001447 [Corynebacterium striatum]|uniref:hypothetical protein n=1 Tax=Corynebacterium striatum TaxID=43770 RepID=UPI0012F8FBDA|nr:hypothetical protein [Corynebacterium striatum]